MEEIVNIRAPLKSSDMLREIASIRRSDLTLVCACSGPTLHFIFCHFGIISILLPILGVLQVVSSWEKELLIREYKVPEHQVSHNPPLCSAAFLLDDK